MVLVHRLGRIKNIILLDKLGSDQIMRRELCGKSKAACVH
jgi:hypothetical protein